MTAGLIVLVAIAFFLVEIGSRTRPNCPGRSKPPGFGKLACKGSVPVSALTPRPTTVTRPFLGWIEPSARTSSNWASST